MSVPIGVRKSLAVMATAAAIFAVYFAIERPWFVRWGATREEVAATRPGDERVPVAAIRSTRAITIAAPAKDVWPWLAQIGQDRGGFYSYEVLEDLAGCQMPRATTIHPEHQAWNPGDRLWMYPPNRLEGIGGAPLVACEPGRHLVFATRQLGTPPREPEDGIWGFALSPIDEKSTRLIAWGRAPGEKHPVAAMLSLLALEPMHHVMEQRMLLNIKALAEGHEVSRGIENATVILWTITVALMLAALIEVGRRPRRWEGSLAIAVAAAVAFQAFTLLQPPPVAVLTILILLCLALVTGRSPRRITRFSPNASQA